MFDFSQEQLAKFGGKLLMVAGGYAGAYLLVMLAGTGYDRMMASKPSPAFLHTWSRRIGGVIGALFVAFLVFRGGGAGTGETGQGGGTATTASPDGTGAKPGTSAGEIVVIAEALSKRPVKKIELTILAGEEVERNTEKFYRLGKSITSVERGAVLAVVADEQRRDQANVVVAYRFGRDAGSRTIAFTDIQTDLKQLNVPFLSDDEFRKIHVDSK